MDDKEEDQHWLDGLADRSNGKASDSAAQVEARLIRKAFLRQNQAQERIFETTEAGFQKLMDAAKRQGLLRSKPRAWNPMLVLQSAYEVLAHPAGVMASIAIVLGLGITVLLQTLELNTPSGYDTLRGGVSSERIVLRVDDAKAVAEEWEKELLQAGVEHSVSFESPQRILIRFRVTPALDIIQNRRIQPPAGEWCTLVIEPKAVHQQ